MFRRALMMGSAALLVVVPGTPGLAAPDGEPVPLAAAALVARPDPAMLAAMQRDLNLSADGALQRLGREQAAHGIDERVRKLAGTGYAGAWLENNSTVLKVGVTRRSLIPAVRSAGATPVLMRHTLSELEAASERLKPVPFPSQSLSGWGVNIRTNRVVIEHLPGGRAAAEKFAAAGRIDVAMVDYAISLHKATGHAEIFAGRKFEFGAGTECTLGFAVQPLFSAPELGNFGFLTAGHCAPPLGLIRAQGGGPLGVTAATTFSDSGAGPDQAWIQVTSGDTTAAQVFTFERPFLVPILGSRPAMNGEYVCRVGPNSSDMYACGTMIETGKNIDFTFEETGAAPRRITGLSTLDVCSDDGNSGGPVLTAGGQAQGIIVGSPSVFNPNTGRFDGLSCKTTPKAQFLYFQPVNPILNSLGLKLFQPPQPAPLRISSLDCDREQYGPGWVCHATWVGGRDPATAAWHVNVPRPTPYVETDAANHFTSAHFACFFEEAEPDYFTEVIVRDALGNTARAIASVCKW